MKKFFPADFPARLGKAGEALRSPSPPIKPEDLGGGKSLRDGHRGHEADLRAERPASEASLNPRSRAVWSKATEKEGPKAKG